MGRCPAPDCRAPDTGVFADGQYLRAQLALITMGTASVCLAVPSLAQKVMLNVEPALRPAWIVVTG